MLFAQISYLFYHAIFQSFPLPSTFSPYFPLLSPLPSSKAGNNPVAPKFNCYNIMRLITRLYSPFANGKYFLDAQHKNVTAIAFDQPGALTTLCSVFAKHNINLSYLRTHCLDLKKGEPRQYRLEISYSNDHHFNFHTAKTELETAGIQIREAGPIPVPWFPRNFEDLDKIGQKLQEVNESKDHSQFQDPEYRDRRDQIAKIALNYKLGNKIPHVKYSKEENDLWSRIYGRLNALHQHSMSHRFLKESAELNKELKVSERIPQLDELSDYLHSRTGFRVKPTHGILSQREFLNAFAFKMFCSTQYLRNHKNPDYTPEPDIVHEIVGHIPMFADPQVAEISHKIGLLSLGASDEEVAKLGTLYWFTLEFGVCKENEKLLGYGAGIASSIGQIEHMLSDKPKFEKLNIFRDCRSPFPVQTVQPIYKVTESFDEAIKDLEKYGRNIMKPITTVYNEVTGQIEYDRNIEAVETIDLGPKF